MAERISDTLKISWAGRAKLLSTSCDLLGYLGERGGRRIEVGGVCIDGVVVVVVVVLVGFA